MRTPFTVLVLCYGDYPQLAHRCVSSILAARTFCVEPPPVWVAMNACGEMTRKYIRELEAEGQLARVYESAINRHKYPVMRGMLRGADGVQTQYTMWFDDDSYVYEPCNFFAVAARTLQAGDADMLGEVWKMTLAGQQHAWIADQPWYTGKPVVPRQQVRFITGGWWAARTGMLQTLNYPWPELDHRGGDVMLGEACRQNNYVQKHYSVGVRINADEVGRPSKSKRRGFDSKPIGWDYQPARSV